MYMLSVPIPLKNNAVIHLFYTCIHHLTSKILCFTSRLFYTGFNVIKKKKPLRKKRLFSQRFTPVFLFSRSHFFALGVNSISTTNP